MSIPPEKRRICAESALRCFGTAYIFERRARSVRRRVRLIAFLGIAAPAALGSTVALVGTKSQYAETAIWLAGIIGALQVAASIWSLVSSWDSDLAYDIESKSENYRLSEELEKLGKATTLTDDEFELEMQLLETQAELRAQLDSRVDVNDKEKRMGLRAALRPFQRAGVGW